MANCTDRKSAVLACLLLVLSCHAGCRYEKPATAPQNLTIIYPFEGAVFPPDIAPPTVRWEDPASASRQWTIAIDFAEDVAGLEFSSTVPHWTPTDQNWAHIQQHSVDRPVCITVRGMNPELPDTPLSIGRTSFTTSRDEVGAPIFYREVNLPFREAVSDPAAHIRWRFGPVSSRQQPPVVLDHLPVCGNCHSFSRDGSVIGMDVDYGNDRGSYAICDVKESMVLDNDSIISWSEFRKEDAKKTLGLLSQVSPDGRYVVSTVKDLSVFEPVDDLTFSQLFFPVKGILCIFDRQAGTFRALPGADDESYVQSNPTWSPDGNYIVFARTKALQVPEARGGGLGLAHADDVPDFVNDRPDFRFDLYRVPFNEGRGGQAEPLAGASHNGRSNYFARYSPDGRWIVFCQANNYMLLQPDSELMIIPSEGGEARRLACNRKLMNSWHSWSPNGHWLVFTSKVFTPYTQLFLAHIDQAGNASPPVLLSRFTSPHMAANIPEFVNAPNDAIRTIKDAFVEDLHYVNKGDQYAVMGREDLALDCFLKALEINPQCGEAYRMWGILLTAQGKYPEAEQKLRKCIELEAHSRRAYWNLAKLMVLTHREQDAVAMFRQAIERDPDYAPIRGEFATLLFRLGRQSEAQEQMIMARQLSQ